MDLRDLTYGYFVKRKSNKHIKTIPESWKKLSVVEVGSGLDNCAPFFDPSLYVAVDLDNSNADDNYRFVKGDINCLPFNDNSFDKFIALGVIEHVEAPLAALKEIRRVSMSGGLVMVPVLDEFPFLYDPVNWVRKKLGKPIVNFGIGGFGHLHVPYKRGWVEYFQKAGFIVQKELPAPSIDIFEALEFFILSIFFSRHEYIEVMDKSRPFEKHAFIVKTLDIIKPVLNFIYRVLFSLNCKLQGRVCYYFLLNKTD